MLILQRRHGLQQALVAENNGFIDTGKHRWHYLKMGSGKRLLLMFHGYGNSASIFASFESYLTAHFTIYSFDLPHHGRSNWDGQELVTKADMATLARVLMEQYSLAKFALCGYSMGGRVCLSLVETMPEAVESVLLIAPDGLRFNPLYFFVTKTAVGRRLFSRVLTKPEGYMRFLERLHRRGWLAAARLRFIQYYMGSERDRQFLQKVWQDTSMLIPSQQRIRKAILTHQLPVFIFMGKHDSVIPLKHGEQFIRNLPSVRLFSMEKGHRVFDRDTLPQMSQCLILGTC